MRCRPSSRLLLIDPMDRILLFRFAFSKGVLSGQVYWATPGGGLESGETFEQAAIRELQEETGLVVDTVGQEIARRKFELQLPDGEIVLAEERFFLVRTEKKSISDGLWTDHEKEVMTSHHWWSKEDLATTSQTIFPVDLLELLQPS